MKVIQLEEMSWKQIEELDNEKTIFFIPVSPLEEHGPHLPVGKREEKNKKRAGWKRSGIKKGKNALFFKEMV